MDEYNVSRTAGKRPAPNTDPQLQPGPDISGYGDSIPFNISHGLITGCHVSNCAQQTNLSRCSACKAVHYCSPAHQSIDRPSHKTFCKMIKKIKFVLDKDEAALRAHGGDADTPRNAFETAVGKFWSYRGTRNYMRSRNELVRELLRANTKAAVEAALEHTLEIMRLNPQDPMAMRCITPALFLRLGRDQECYDFCKWWVTTGNNVDYNWNDAKLPHEMMSGEDAFESVEIFQQIRDFGASAGKKKNNNNNIVPSFADLSHLVAITLLKVRMLFDLRTLHMGTGEMFPELSCSSIALDWYNSGTGQELPLPFGAMKDEVWRLYHAVERVNKHFWPALINPGINLMANPYSVGMGDESEMQKVLNECYNAWAETKGGAIDVIRDLSQGRDISPPRRDWKKKRDTLGHVQSSLVCQYGGMVWMVVHTA